MQVGRLIVLTGPSGVGKGALVRALRSRNQELYLSVSATTRSPRRGEVDGKDYYFVNSQQFEDMIVADELLEWAEYAGNYYGTPKLPVQKKIAQGQSVILEIEVVGARKIKQTFPDALRIFILPPSLTELEQRLRKRGKDSETVIKQRLECAQEEIAASSEFDWQIVNDNFETALAELETAINLVTSP